MKNLTWQNHGQYFVTQELKRKVKLKYCGIQVWLKILNNKQVLAVLYVLFTKFVTSKRLLVVSSDRAFSNLPLVGNWTIHGCG